MLQGGYISRKNIRDGHFTQGQDGSVQKKIYIITGKRIGDSWGINASAVFILLLLPGGYTGKEKGGKACLIRYHWLEPAIQNGSV